MVEKKKKKNEKLLCEMESNEKCFLYVCRIIFIFRFFHTVYILCNMFCPLFRNISFNEDENKALN